MTGNIENIKNWKLQKKLKNEKLMKKQMLQAQ
nr:MAG TPA: Histo-aspartic protease-aspartic protease, HAP, Plasmepsin, Aspartic [Caudoviricetes sp.]